mmetsp:Transcript_32062/g.90190  ORF Transcript_32062/g.90190 Transcript_32062/m.90190 type:complete len:183 (-) Transcript_32062:54-602(-)
MDLPPLLPTRPSKPLTAKQDRMKAKLKKRHGEPSDGKDVFTDFVCHIEAEKHARRGALHDSHEDDRKRLSQVHRTTRLMLDLINDDELKDKRYSQNGHKVIMHNLTRENRSRSDPALVAEATRKGESPEVNQVRKLNRLLYRKPATPPPPPPPKPQPLDAGLRDQITDVFRKPDPARLPSTF